MATHPLVSVVVPTYNHEAYIADALESILAQEQDFPVEVLVGDDKSTDRTLDIVLDYQQRHPSVFRVLASETNIGMNQNHFRLLRSARGQYIAYCEGDDFWNSPDKLARQVRFLEENSSYGLVHSDYTHMSQLRGAWRVCRRVNRSDQAPPEGWVFDALLRTNFVSTGTVVVRTRAVLDYLDSWQDQALDFPVGDWPLWLSVSASWRFGYLDDDLATYRRTPGSVTNSGLGSDIRRNRALVGMLAELGARFDLPHTSTTNAQAELVHHVLYLAWRAGDRRSAAWATRWLKHNKPDLLTFRKRVKVRAFETVPALTIPYGLLCLLRQKCRMLRIYRDPADLPGEPHRSRF